jgi:hypothetical protein
LSLAFQDKGGGDVREPRGIHGLAGDRLLNGFLGEDRARQGEQEESERNELWASWGPVNHPGARHGTTMVSPGFSKTFWLTSLPSANFL